MQCMRLAFLCGFGLCLLLRSGSRLGISFRAADEEGISSTDSDRPIMDGLNSGENDDLYQIALLIDQLKHDEVTLRANASKNITKIARALGPERTRDELIPFLSECVDDEDEVISIIAEELGKLCALVGGTNHVHKLLPPLELLICCEESTVRSMSARSVEAVVDSMSDEGLCAHFYPFLSKLANKDWFTARASAATLLHLGFRRFTAKIQDDVFAVYLRLCKDETPLVRRLAAQSLDRWARLLADSPLKQKELLGAFKALIHDDQDSIRIQIVPISISIAALMPADAKSDILAAVVEVSRDKSWRVRWSLAHKVQEVFAAMKAGAGPGSVILPESAQASLSTVFNNLLNDGEAEVKGAAAAHLSAVCAHMKRAALLEFVIPSAQRLSTDPSEFVRSFFATEVSKLAPLLGKEDTLAQVIPLLHTLLKDSNSEVRLNVISGLNSISAVIGVDLLSQSLLPAITELAADSKWRVRLAVIENMPMLAKQLGVQFFNEKLINLSLGWLSDTVFSIRKAAAENLWHLTAIFGEEWARANVVPRIREMQTNAAFSKRMTALYAVQVLLTSAEGRPGPSHAMAAEVLLPIVLTMAADPVPNIRFNVAKTLAHAYVLFRQEYRAAAPAEIHPVLARLAGDLDRDVRQNAEMAIGVK